MASEDVIELGSSDEDSEPLPKKPRIQKPMPNAMVCIPNKFREVTIKPSKSAKLLKPANTERINPLSITKGLGKGVTVKKVTPINLNPVPILSRSKVNGKPPQRILGKPVLYNTVSNIQVPVTLLSKSGINAPKGKVSVLPESKLMRPAVVSNRGISVLKSPIRVNSPGAIRLPSTITVKKTTTTVKRINIVNMPTVKRKPKLPPKKPQELLTVDLDDDDGPASASTSSPQWYLRPEDGTSKKQEENNKEPEGTKYVEITIEDSPIKPVQNKRACEIGTELAITIDDSPIKPIPEKNKPVSGSEDESDNNTKVPHSKKKLEYPYEASNHAKTIEIELEPIESDMLVVEYNAMENPDAMEALPTANSKTENADKKRKDNTEINKIDHTDKLRTEKYVETVDKKRNGSTNINKTDTDKIRIGKPDKNRNSDKNKYSDENKKMDKCKNEDLQQVETIDDDVETIDDDKLEDSFKHVETIQTSTPKKKKANKAAQEPIDDDVIITNDAVGNEFHPVYQRFIDLCFCLENSEDMKTIIDKKIKSYYRQVPKEYTESEEFVDMVSSKILAMKASPEKMYLYIKDIVDELNLQRKLAKSQAAGNKDTKSAESEPFLYGNDSEFDFRRRRQIRKLEKTIKKLHRAIQKLEEQEVDFDDEDDSVYLLTERYKERMVRVYAKFCQLTNTKMPSEPRIQLEGRPGQPSGPAKRLEKWINKKVPIGTPLPFPDFHDVLRCVRDANDLDKLGWNEADIMEEARDLFTRCGRKLQRRRQENEWRTAASRIASDVDPAENNNELKKRLDENKQLGTKKETDIFNKYADRQNLLKLEAVEIGDKEAEESPVESEDEDANEAENVSLETTVKRKERLKRLLQEKSKKVSEEKEVLKEKCKNIGKEKENQTKQLITVTSSKSPRTNEVTTENIDEKEPKDLQSLQEKDSKNYVEEHSKKQANENDAIGHKKAQEIVMDTKEGGKQQLYKIPKDEGSVKVEQSKSENKNDDIQETHSISDDSSKVESDIDELHLLQKLHSENDNRTSTLDSSDSDSPIAISDTLESSGDAKNKQQSDDVISIENSSYSEPEIDNDEYADNNAALNKSVEKLIHSNMEVEYSTDGVEQVQNKTNNDEYNESVEEILLASSGDEAETQREENILEKDNEMEKVDGSVNLKDAPISTDEISIDNGRNMSSMKELVKSDGLGNKSKQSKENVADSSDNDKKETKNAVEKNPDRQDDIIVNEVSLIEDDNHNPRDKKNDTQEVFSAEYLGNEVKDGTVINEISSVENLDHQCENANNIQDIVSTEESTVNKLEEKNNVKDIISVEEIHDVQPEIINEVSSIEEILDSQPEDNMEDRNVHEVRSNEANTDGNIKDANLNESSDINNLMKKDEGIEMVAADIESGDNQKYPNLITVTKNIESTDSSQGNVKECAKVTEAKVISDNDRCDESVEYMDVDECGNTQGDINSNALMAENVNKV